MDKSNTVECMTDRYLERYGRALIGIYYLPPMTENWEFPVFMNSLLVTLRRMDLMPGYTWFMDANEGHYLILWVNGYFRNDLSGINPTINRLWQIHSALPINIIDCIAVSSEVPDKEYEQLVTDHDSLPVSNGIENIGKLLAEDICNAVLGCS